MTNRFVYHYRRTKSLLQRGLRSLRVRGLKASLAMISPTLKQADANSSLRFPSPSEIQDVAAADFGCEQARISLIIPIHNKLDLTLACLASIQLHRNKNNFEVIVVDDASSDSSFEFLSAIRGLRVFRMPRQSGYVLSSNKGAEQARGDMLVFLNNDTVVQEHWLEHLLDTFKRFPDTGIAGAKLLYPNGLLQEAGGAVFNDGSVWNLGRFEKADNPRFNYVREVDYVSGAVLAIRKQDFNELKGFDSYFAPGYFEDTDLAMRASAQGLKIRYQPFSRVVHHEGATSGTRLDSGMKAFQVPHQIKFAERWKETLSDYPTRPETGLQSMRLAFKSHKKEILILDEHTPQINSDSGSLRLFHLLKSLQNENCDVHFVPADLAFNPEHTSVLQQQGIACYYRPWTKSLFEWLNDNAQQFDRIIVCRVGLMSSIYDVLRSAAPKAKLIFDTVDLHHIREAQEAALSQSESLARQAQATKVKEYALIERCDETWVVSETEKWALQKSFPKKTIRRVSNIHPLRHDTPKFSERRDILFVGNFRHPPNADGLQWFLETVWPLVHARRPDIKLNIVGTAAPASLVTLSEGMNIDFLGRVDDIERIIDTSRINIAPLRYGAGAKGKISQALTSGLPTIATSVAVDGMGLTNEQSALFADSAEGFCRAIFALYEDEGLWNLLSNNGYRIAEESFSESAVSRELLSAIASD